MAATVSDRVCGCHEQVERTRLLAEVTRLRDSRNEAMSAASRARDVITRLRSRVAELEGRS